MKLLKTSFLFLILTCAAIGLSGCAEEKASSTPFQPPATKYSVEIDGKSYKCLYYYVEPVKVETFSAMGLISTYEKEVRARYRIKLYDYSETSFDLKEVSLDTICETYKVEKLTN